MEKCLVWYTLSLKQNMKKPGTWLLLGVMVFLLWIVGNIRMPDPDNTKVAICYNGSNYEKQLQDAIDNGEPQFTFVQYEQEEMLSKAVKKGDVECGFVLAEDFDEKIQRGDWEDAVICYTNPFGTKTDVAKETLYMAMFPIYSRWLLTETEDEIYATENPDRLEELLRIHDEYLDGTLFLTIEEVLVESKEPNKAGKEYGNGQGEGKGITHGLVELFVLLSMLLAAGVYGEKETVQIEKALLRKEKNRFRYIHILANATMLSLAGLIVVLLSKESQGVMIETLKMAVLVFSGGFFALIFAKLFKNRLTYISWVATFVICFLLARFGIAGYLNS